MISNVPKMVSKPTYSETIHTKMNIMYEINYFSFPENGKLLKKKFGEPKSCLLQSPETSKKIL